MIIGTFTLYHANAIIHHVPLFCKRGRGIFSVKCPDFPTDVHEDGICKLGNCTAEDEKRSRSIEVTNCLEVFLFQKLIRIETAPKRGLIKD